MNDPLAVNISAAWNGLYIVYSEITVFGSAASTSDITMLSPLMSVIASNGMRQEILTIREADAGVKVMSSPARTLLILEMPAPPLPADA
jgi:hypothetical protein